MAVKVVLISLGCPKNQVDSEQMLYLLKNAGMEPVAEPGAADVAVINTCGFIESAVKEGLSEIFSLASLKKEGRLKKILVTGCIPERYQKDFLAELPEVDGVLGTGSCRYIVSAVEALFQDKRFSRFDDIDAPCPECGRILLSPPYTAYLKIAEGCDNHCAYCVIPSLRGRYRSRSEDDILSEANALAENGAKELILVAQDLSRYGLDRYGKRRLSSLLRRLCAIDKIKWIRLHYLYPDEIDDELIGMIAENDKILNYFDIPIQHINDNILKRMNRRGGRALIEGLFAKIRARIPDAVIRTSIIAGLPGETDREFSELCEFLKEAKMPRAGIFPYSPEEGSAAVLMGDQVDDEIKRRRVEILQDIQYSVMEEYHKSRIGQTLTVLCEGFDAGLGYYYGRSFADSPDIDAKVFFQSGIPPLTGSFVPVKITKIIDSDCFGEIATQESESNL